MNNPVDTSALYVRDLNGLCDAIGSKLTLNHAGKRAIIAIAGAPGAGKSTLLSNLVPILRKQLSPKQVIGIPMDGYHLDNVQLDQDGTRAVKGAPHTFDVHGLCSLVERLYSGQGPIYAPEFDRAGDLSKNCAIKIEQAHNVVLIEGNYLLLDQPGWQELAKFFAVTISIDVPTDVLRQRLVQRWLHYGLSQEDALEKALGNDIPNAETVIEQSIPADIIFQPENHK